MSVVDDFITKERENMSMNKHVEYTPEGICARKISFGLEDGKLHNVKFAGGCPGNLAAIGKLIEGQDAEKIAGILKGNLCRGKNTSCADQLAKAIEEND